VERSTSALVRQIRQAHQTVAFGPSTRVEFNSARRVASLRSASEIRALRTRGLALAEQIGR
jgi:hypothetical protein